ncbi:MAG: cytochrome c oxidase subunit II [Candidatus Obscuribacterales bacterium]|nr:cytochrome c oxidase subunit II [Candidatus Obscuribacterales bacterium]
MEISNADLTSIFNVVTSQNKWMVDLHMFTAAICTIIFIVVAGLLVAIIGKFKTPENDDGSEPRQVRGNVRLEIVWTAIPLLIVIVLGVLTAIVMLVVNPAVGSKKPDLIVVGHQWWWEYQYPKYGVTTANEFYLPLGKNSLVEVRSADVVHSFWVIAFGQKMDAIPGHPTNMWIHPTKKGLFLGTCSEYCGAQHGLMRIIANVVSPEDFETWIKAQAVIPAVSEDATVLKGKELFNAATCVQCHRVAGNPDAQALIGPDLTHLAQRKTLGAGVLENTPENLAKWMQNPQTFKPGINMPNMRLTDADAHSIAVYLESLK